jgi:hypothetical protein
MLKDVTQQPWFNAAVDTLISARLELRFGWARQDSNLRPWDYEICFQITRGQSWFHDVAREFSGVQPGSAPAAAVVTRWMLRRLLFEVPRVHLPTKVMLHDQGGEIYEWDVIPVLQKRVLRPFERAICQRIK